MAEGNELPELTNEDEILYSRIQSLDGKESPWESDPSFAEEMMNREIMDMDLERDVSNQDYNILQKQVSSYQERSLLFCVIGASGVGKSSFINVMCGLQPGDEGAAEIGVGDTTMKPKIYTNPINAKVQFVDVQGYGSPSSRMTEQYLKEIHADEVDFFLIFYLCITEFDEWIMKELQKRQKRFLLVRSRADDFAKKSMKGKSVMDWIKEVKRKGKKNLQLCGINDVAIFVVSNTDPEIGEMNELFGYVENNLPSLKRETLLLSIQLKTKNVIEKKKTALLGRAWGIAAFISITGVLPLPAALFDIPIILKEVQLYLETFGLTPKCLDRLPLSKQRQLIISYEMKKGGIAAGLKLVIAGLSGIILAKSGKDIFKIFLPVIGLVTVAVEYPMYVIVLRKLIEKMAAEANEMHQFIVRQLNFD